jgi:hypothetical protein
MNFLKLSIMSLVFSQAVALAQPTGNGFVAITEKLELWKRMASHEVVVTGPTQYNTPDGYNLIKYVTSAAGSATLAQYGLFPYELYQKAPIVSFPSIPIVKGLLETAPGEKCSYFIKTEYYLGLTPAPKKELILAHHVERIVDGTFVNNRFFFQIYDDLKKRPFQVVVSIGERRLSNGTGTYSGFSLSLRGRDLLDIKTSKGFPSSELTNHQFMGRLPFEVFKDGFFQVYKSCITTL